MSDTHSLLGKTLAGRYDIRDHLGKGGMGSVYLAHDSNLHRDVAIKLLSLEIATNAELRRRFDNEAKSIARLEHPNIVDIYDYQPGTDDHPPFFAMRFLDGGTLKDRIKEGEQYSLEETVALINKIASALNYCHERGIVHRDIKPSNIMFDKGGQPYLVDFGIIKDLEGQGMTTTTGLVGTAEYMSPEQILQSPVTGAADQYATAIMIYQMLTGRLPYDVATSTGGTGSRPSSSTGSYSSHFEAHIKGTPLDITQMRADLPAGIMKVLGQALEKKPEDRYPTIIAFASAFEDAVHGRKPPTITRRSTSPKTTAKARTSERRGGGMVIAGVVGLLALVIGALAVLFFSGAFDDDSATQTETAVAVAQAQAEATETEAVILSQTAAVPITETAQAEIDATATQAVIDAALTLDAGATQDAQATGDAVASATQAIRNAQGTSTAIVVTDAALSTSVAATSTADSVRLQTTFEAQQTAVVQTATQSALDSTSTAVMQATRDVQATLDGIMTATEDAARMIAEVQQARSTARVQQTLDAGGLPEDINTPAQIAAAPTTSPALVSSVDGTDYGQSVLLFSARADDDASLDLYRVNLDGTGVTAVIESDELDEQQVAISPDGTQIAYVAGVDGASELFVANINGSDLRQITDFGGEVTWPFWSPNGDVIAVTVRLPDEMLHTIHVIDVADGTDQAVTAPGLDAQRSVYSPDGGQIAFYGGTDNRDLYMMNVEDLIVERLTDDPAADVHPSWSPSGAVLAFASDRDGVFRLYLLDLASGAVTPLASGDADAAAPSFNRAGDGVIFCTDDALMVLDFATGSATPITAAGACPSGVGMASR